MIISEKYGIPPETVKRLIADGVFTCAVSKHELVIESYKKDRGKGLPSMQAISNAADIGHVSERQVYRILKSFDIL